MLEREEGADRDSVTTEEDVFACYPTAAKC